MKILINLAGITKRDSQEVYAASVLKSLLPRLEGQTVLVFLSREFPADTFSGASVRFKYVPFLGSKFFTAFFTQCILPFYVFFLRIESLYSPVMSFPVLQAGRSFPTLHDLDYAHSDSSGSFFARAYMKMMYKAAVTHAKKCFTISHAIAREASEKYGTSTDNLIVVHNSLPSTNSTYADISAISPMPYFLYIGIDRPRKNIRILIEAYSKICGDVSESLVLAGAVINNEKELRAFANALHCEERLVFTGYVSDAEKNSLYKNATATIVPSLYEGFGFPVLEAHHHGTPVILSDIEVFHEVAGGAGLFFNPSDSDSLASVMKSITGESVPRSELVAKGNENLQRFSWELTAETIASTITAK